RDSATGQHRQLVTCADLLLGVLSEPTGVAAQIARHFSLDAQKARKALSSCAAAATAGSFDDLGAPVAGDAAEDLVKTGRRGGESKKHLPAKIGERVRPERS